jgi:hypothetical protein
VIDRKYLHPNYGGKTNPAKFPLLRKELIAGNIFT